MKKMIVICLSLLMLCGCSKNNMAKKEESMQQYAKDYFETFMTGVDGRDEAAITLEDFKEANEEFDKSYDLKIFENCKETSSVKITIKKGKNEISNYDYNLNCKK